jgi:hypothetical protein
MLDFISRHPYLISSVIIIALWIWWMRANRHRIPVPVDRPWIPSEISFFNHQIKTKGGIFMSQAKVDQKFHATWPNPVDKYGNPATVQDGSVKFTSDDETIATVEPNPDGGPYSCTVTTQKKTGATAVRIAADSDLDQSPNAEKIITGQLAVEVLPGEATGFADPSSDDAVDNTDTPE